MNPLLPSKLLPISLSCGETPANLTSIIAVTGLAGHAYGSWATEQHMWLRDFLPSEMPNVRVMTYGYNSQLTESMSRQDFDQHAEDFAEGLESVWRSNYVRRSDHQRIWTY